MKKVMKLLKEIIINVLSFLVIVGLIVLVIFFGFGWIKTNFLNLIGGFIG